MTANFARGEDRFLFCVKCSVSFEAVENAVSAFGMTIANVLSPENGVAAHKFWDSCAHQLTKEITPDPDYPIGIVLDSLRPTLGGRKEGRKEGS